MLNILEDEGRFIVDPSRPDAPFEFPPFFFGDIKPLSLRAFRKGASGLYAIDLSTYQITLLFGEPNSRPELGFWQLTTTAGTSKPLAARARAQDVVAAMLTAFGPIPTTVKGGSGSYIITLNVAGVWVLPSASFQGNTLSNVLVFPITLGTTTTPAQFRVEVLEVAPARVIPANWTAGSTTVVSTFTQASGLLWHLVLDTRVDNGFFTLTVDAATTSFISWGSSAYSIAVALAAAGKAAAVQSDGQGGFWVSFVSVVTTASVGGNLVILPYQTGSLALASTGVRELLNGLQFASVKLTVLLAKNGQNITAASADVMLLMPVNQPATIVIDAPMMAGMTFAISDDQAYLYVYINAVLTYEIPLNAV